MSSSDERRPLLIFDYDGTIHQTHLIYEPAILETVGWLNREYELSMREPDTARIRSWLGMKTEEMWEDFAPSLPMDMRAEAGKRVGDIMRRKIEEGCAVWYPGAENVLSKLKDRGFRMVILSNCDRVYADANWKAFHMERWFDAFVDCASYPGMSKKDILRKMLQSERNGRQFEPDRYIMIGDRANDIAAGYENGIRTLGCLYGYGRSQEFEHADRMISDIALLTDLRL